MSQTSYYTDESRLPPRPLRDVSPNPRRRGSDQQNTPASANRGRSSSVTRGMNSIPITMNNNANNNISNNQPYVRGQSYSPVRSAQPNRDIGNHAIIRGRTEGPIGRHRVYSNSPSRSRRAITSDRSVHTHERRARSASRSAQRRPLTASNIPAPGHRRTTCRSRSSSRGSRRQLNNTSRSPCRTMPSASPVLRHTPADKVWDTHLHEAQIGHDTHDGNSANDNQSNPPCDDMIGTTRANLFTAVATTETEPDKIGATHTDDTECNDDDDDDEHIDVIKIAGISVAFDSELTNREIQLMQIIQKLQRKYDVLKTIAGTTMLILVSVLAGVMLGFVVPWKEWLKASNSDNSVPPASAPFVANQTISMTPSIDLSLTAMPTITQTVDYEVRREAMLSALSLFVSEEAILLDRSSPQGKAFEWLVYTDPRKVKPGASNLVQRFVSSLLIFQMPTESHVSYIKWFGRLWECSWAGFECNDQSIITKIQLPQRNILGTLPVELSYLERLETLVLSNNDIFGEIPSALAELKLLKILDLSNNTINGALPDSLFQQTNLQKVVLSNNSIHGSIPSSLANLSSLRIVQFENNQLSGSVPHGVCELPNLEHISVDCVFYSQYSVECACCKSCPSEEITIPPPYSAAPTDP